MNPKEEISCECARTYLSFRPFYLLIGAIIALVWSIILSFMMLQFPPYMMYWYVILLGLVVGIVTDSAVIGVGIVFLVYFLAEYFRGGFLMIYLNILNFMALGQIFGSMILLFLVITTWIFLGMFFGNIITMSVKTAWCHVKCSEEI